MTCYIALASHVFQPKPSASLTAGPTVQLTTTASWQRWCVEHVEPTPWILGRLSDARNSDDNEMGSDWQNGSLCDVLFGRFMKPTEHEGLLR